MLCACREISWRQTNSPKKVLGTGRTRYLRKAGTGRRLNGGLFEKSEQGEDGTPRLLRMNWGRDGYFCPYPREGRRGRCTVLENLNQRLDWRTSSTEEQRTGQSRACLPNSGSPPAPPCLGTQAHWWTPAPLFQQGSEESRETGPAQREISWQGDI